MKEEWTCYAQPASQGGKRCGHVNKGGVLGPGLAGKRLVCCEACGCTKIASDSRRERLERGK